MSDDLVAFLAARYAEEWGAARDRELAQGLDESHATRDIDAKREILSAYADRQSWVNDIGDPDTGPDNPQWETGARDALLAVLEILAAVYRDRPDYRSEWKP